LTAAYKANGLSWSFNSDGILGAMDALYAGAVSGTGTFWMPVAPGITSLPSNPTVSTGTGAAANSTTTPSGFDPTAPGAVLASLPTGQAPSYAKSIAPAALVPYVNETVPLVAGTRTALSVTALDYALTLPTGTAVLVTKAEITAAVSLAVAGGAATLTGQAAVLKYTKAISANVGDYVSSGFGAGSISNFKIGANYGYLELSGSEAQARIPSRIMSAVAGSAELLGSTQKLITARRMAADGSLCSMTGRAAALKWTYFQTNDFTGGSYTEFSFNGTANEYNFILDGCTAVSYSSMEIRMNPSSVYFAGYTRYEDGVAVATSGSTQSASTPGFTGNFSPPKSFRLRSWTTYSNYWPSNTVARFYNLSYSTRVSVTATQ
jgi:hypothetical protein